MEHNFATQGMVSFLFGIFCAYWAQGLAGMLGSGSSLDYFCLPLPALFYALKIAVIKKK